MGKACNMDGSGKVSCRTVSEENCEECGEKMSHCRCEFKENPCPHCGADPKHCKCK